MNVIKLVTALTILIGLTKPALADDWTTEDSYRQAGVYTVLALDWAQTRDIKNHPKFSERNPILGKHPTDKQVNSYFLAVGLAHTAIAYNLPPTWRRGFQYATIAIQVVQIIKNKRSGVSFEF